MTEESFRLLGLADFVETAVGRGHRIFEDQRRIATRQRRADVAERSEQVGRTPELIEEAGAGQKLDVNSVAVVLPVERKRRAPSSPTRPFAWRQAPCQSVRDYARPVRIPMNTNKDAPSPIKGPDGGGGGVRTRLHHLSWISRYTRSSPGGRSINERTVSMPASDRFS